MECLESIENCTSYMLHFMEFLNGGSLQWHLKNKGFTEKEVVFYSAQILCAILFLHGKKIVHRDIKLTNVLMDSSGNAKLCDFGLCKIMNSTTHTMGGTEEFRSPESFIPGYLNYSLDFWSFGVCIFYMLTNELPFANEEIIKNDSMMPDLNETRNKYRTKTLNKMPALFHYHNSTNCDVISEIASNFVSRLLNKNLNERLGNKENNEYLKSDEFFTSIEWDLLENGQLKPPIKPKLVILIFYKCILYNNEMFIFYYFLLIKLEIISRRFSFR